MKTVNDVKRLISDNETQEAIHLLQAILEDKSKSLQNQVILLESQFNEVQKKMQIGIMQESSELNRINMSLLSICDDPKVVDSKIKQNDNVTSDPVSLFQNPMVKYGAIGIGVLVLISIIANSGGGEISTTGNNIEQQSQMNTPPITANANNGSVNWHASPSTITVKEKGYNDMKIEIVGISSIEKTAEEKLVTIVLKLECIDKNVDVCVENDLKYVFKNPTNQVNSSSETTTESRFGVGTSIEHKIDFEVPKGMHEANLEIYYIRKLKQTFKVEF